MQTTFPISFCSPMALILPRLSSTMTTSLLFFTIFFFFFSTLVSGKSHPFSRNISPEALGLKREKLTHLRFYFHDIVSGPNASAFIVAEASMTNKSKTGFGSVFMIDDPLTIRPELSSKLVGKAQGLYASAALNELGFLMVMNFAFIEGKYNGSSLSLLGRNTVFSEVREMPIVGGSGLFRFARGYAQAKTHTVTRESAIVEYNVFVYHY